MICRFFDFYSCIMDSHKPRINGGMVANHAGQWVVLVGSVSAVRAHYIAHGSHYYTIYTNHTFPMEYDSYQEVTSISLLKVRELLPTLLCVH